jgi:DNA-binding IclR family transcriptional regulator
METEDAVKIGQGSGGGQYPVESVRRALRVLQCFGLDHPELGVSDIARQLSMHKSTVHRLLTTLQQEGFVHQVDGNRYTLGWKVFELGAVVPAWQAIRQPVLRVLESLVNETGETAHLAILNQGEVLYVEKVEASRSLRMPSAVGRRVPVHCTALGKVLIAGLEDQIMREMIYGAPLAAFTKNTITDPDRLREEIEEIRRQGYAVDHEEIDDGLMCIGARVVDHGGRTCAAISISGPSPRILSRLERHVEAVQRACHSLSGELGANAQRLLEMNSQPVDLRMERLEERPT